MRWTNTNFDVHPAGERLAAEIIGVDLSVPLDIGLVRRITVALLEHKALLFRGQHLDDEAHLRVAARFGEPTAVSSSPNTDETVVRTPAKATLLRVAGPGSGSATVTVANCLTAYEDLSQGLRDFVDRLWAVHADEDASDGRGHRRAVHPVVLVHPVTGERGLFLGASTRQVVGLDPGESYDLLRTLTAAIERPRNRVTWHLAPGDLVFYDNRSTAARISDASGPDGPARRVTLTGDAPLGVNGNHSYLIDDDRMSGYDSVAS